MCVSFQYYFQKQKLNTKHFVILFVLYSLELGLLDLCLHSDLCNFCATFSFQKIKETSKEEENYVNTKLAFAVPPRKIQKGAKQVQGDNGLLVITNTSACQEHSQLSSLLSIAAAVDHLLNPGAATQKHPSQPQPSSTQTQTQALHCCAWCELREMFKR